MKKVTLIRLVSLLLMLALMIGIFVLSGQNAEESGNLSSGLTYRLFCLFYPHFLAKTPPQQDVLMSGFETLVRKAAHFSLYFALGAVAFVVYITYQKMSLRWRCAFPIFTGVLYAVSDEIHQLFIAGRSCEFRDVMIDSCGVVLACFLALWIYQKMIRKKERKK
ncbi:MAG: VanZ family protein [Clostridia bacterium]|nr:VanZ family protein [Clostridia bacterium]